VFVDGGTYYDAFCPGQLNCNGYNSIFAQNLQRRRRTAQRRARGDGDGDAAVGAAGIDGIQRRPPSGRYWVARGGL
jgi:hypothetical protein